MNSIKNNLNFFEFENIFLNLEKIKFYKMEKYILKTEKDPISWDFYNKQEACDWSAKEFKFIQDKKDYLEAPPRVKELLKGIFGFFLIGDGLISEDIIIFLKEAIEEENWPKVFYLSMQLKIENTHAETYSKAALTIIPKEEHQQMIEMCENLECVKNKGLWIKKYATLSNESKALRNVACAVGEGVFFVSLFAIIFYIRKLNIFQDFIESNEQISKDESIHRDEKASEAKRSLKPEEHQQAIEIIKSGVEVEKQHASYLLSKPIISEQSDIDSGMTIENLEGYIETLADQICVLCGIPKIYNTTVELKWMEDINLSQKTNFYERDVVGSYRKFGNDSDDDDEDF